MADSKRSYEFQPPNIQDEDIKELATFAGSKYQLSGLLFSGNGNFYLIQFPDECRSANAYTNLCPSWEELSEILRQSNDPVMEFNKSFIRKSQYVISGMTQQRVWTRDGFQCVYCGKKFGDVLMTIDHWLPLELGGQANDSNLLSSCRSCNKAKGNIHPEEWCKTKNLDYYHYTRYLAGDHRPFTKPFIKPPF